MQAFKVKKVGAKKGYDLLKKKADALMAAYLQILKQVFELKKNMGKDYTNCSVAMADATYAAGDFGIIVRDQIGTTANTKVRITTENVAGVMKPTFIAKSTQEMGLQDELIGITGGGQAIQRTREAYKRYLKLLISIASLQTQFIAVERVL